MTGPPQLRSRECRARGRLQHKPIAAAEMLRLALRTPITGVPRAREAAAQGGISTARRRQNWPSACAGGCSTHPIAVAESPRRMLRLVLRNADHGSAARGRLQHKPIAAAESRLRGRRRGDAKTGLPQADHGSAARGTLQHKPIAAAESRLRERRCGDAKLALRNPITGVPHAREAAAQTHSCGKF